MDPLFFFFGGGELMETVFLATRLMEALFHGGLMETFLFCDSWKPSLEENFFGGPWKPCFRGAQDRLLGLC